jgi:hypothetical protein
MAPQQGIDLVELLDSAGRVTARYQRRRGPDGGWVRHGAYVGYHRNGAVSTEGEYQQGREEGLWRDYHDNGWIACVGRYHQGREQGLWRFFDREGNEGEPLFYGDGQVAPAGAGFLN